MIKDQKKFSVLVADDSRIMMEGLVSLIGTIPIVSKVSGVLTGQAVVEQVKKGGIDVVLLDMRMPGDLDGINAGVCVLKNYPAVKIIFITFYDDVDLLLTLLKTGAHGLLIKGDTHCEEIAEAISAIMNGETFYSERIHKIVNQNMHRFDQLRPVQLSERDLSLVKFIGQGLTSSQIADKINLSVLTVETMRKELLKKTLTKNTPELIQFTSRAGLL